MCIFLCFSVYLAEFAAFNCVFAESYQGTEKSSKSTKNSLPVAKWEETYRNYLERQSIKIGDYDSKKNKNGESETTKKQASDLDKTFTFATNVEKINANKSIVPNPDELLTGFYVRYVPGLVFKSDQYYSKFELPLRLNSSGNFVADYQSPEDLSRMFRSIRLGNVSYPLYFTGGEFPSYTLGTGNLIRNYISKSNIERKIWGANLKINTSLFGGEVFLDDVIRNNFYGVSVYIQPLPQMKFSSNYVKDKRSKLELYSASGQIEVSKNFFVFYELSKIMGSALSTETSFWKWQIGHKFGAWYYGNYDEVKYSFSASGIFNKPYFLHGFINELYDVEHESRLAELKRAGSDYGLLISGNVNWRFLTLNAYYDLFNREKEKSMHGYSLLVNLIFGLDAMAEYFDPNNGTIYFITKISKSFFDIIRIKGEYVKSWTGTSNSNDLVRSVYTQFGFEIFHSIE